MPLSQNLNHLKYVAIPCIYLYIFLICLLIRCRFGFFHVVNNHYSRWLMYAVGGSSHPTIYSQGNRFKAPNLVNCKEVGHTFTLKHYKPSPFMMWMARITPLPDGSDPWYYRIIRPSYGLINKWVAFGRVWSLCFSVWADPDFKVGPLNIWDGLGLSE